MNADRLVGAARALIGVSLSVLVLDAVLMSRWVSAAADGASRGRLWASYAVVAALHAAGLAWARSAPPSRAAGAALLAAGAASWFLLGVDAHHLLFKPEPVLLGAAGALLLGASRAPGA